MCLRKEARPMDQETKKTNDEEVKTGDVKSPKDTKEKVEKKSVKHKVKEKINKVDPKDEKIKELEEQLKQAKNDRARAYADAENMKKRLQKEADNAKKYRFQQAGLALLPIVDNMGMAIKVDSENEELTNYVKGFEMIYQQLQRVLEDEGVKEIEAQGKPFDHNTMQALMQEKKEDTEPGIVLEVMQKGYMLKDRILRPALVKVSE